MYYKMKRVRAAIGLKQCWRGFLGIGSQKYTKQKYMIFAEKLEYSVKKDLILGETKSELVHHIGMHFFI